MSNPFIAEVRIFPYTFPPLNWAFCGGSLLPVGQYQALFSLVGTTYGGNGQQTFGIPNLKGRAPMSVGDGPGLTPRSWGEIGGSVEVTLLSTQIPGHNHTMIVDTEPSTVPAPGGNYAANPRVAGGPVFTTYFEPSGNTFMGSNCLANTGGNQAHENMQPYLAMQFCIALEGLYPARN